MALMQKAAFAVVMLGLAACSSQGGGAAGAVLSSLRAPKTTGPATGDIPRSEIEKAGVPIMRVRVPARGLDTLMVQRDTRGDVVTWTAGDGSTFAFQKGILIETRGLGADLMSASGPTAGMIAAGGTHARSYFFIGPDDKTLRRDYECTPSNAGAETVSIYGLGYGTTHIAEVCQRPEGRITNDFWLQGATLRKSRQWVSAGAGYAEFELVTD